MAWYLHLVKLINPLPTAMPQPLTPAQIYAQLEALVLPTLTDYQSDLTVQDRNTLKAYTGPFLLTYRPTGTHLLVLGEAQEFLIAGDERKPAQQIERTFDRKRAEVSWDYQQHFLHFTGSEFKYLSQVEALALVDAHKEQLLAKVNAKKAVLA